MSRFLSVCALSFVLALTVVSDADAARRLGGGRSVGIQRESVTRSAAIPPRAPTQQPAPHQQQAQSPAAAAQPSGWRRWAGPLAGLAAGLGLAALMSHLGLGAEFGSALLMLVLGAIVLLLVFRFFAGRSRSPAMAYQAQGEPAASLPSNRSVYSDVMPQTPSRSAHPDPAQSLGSQSFSITDSVFAQREIPPGFDEHGFLAQARVHFMRLQEANDAGNIHLLAEFVEPELLKTLTEDIQSRQVAVQHIEVVDLQVDLLSVETEPSQYVAAVRYMGSIREAPHLAPESFKEVWLLTKPKEGTVGWRVAGIQQIQS